MIAPGGSVIYGAEAMEHLREISVVVYLKLDFEEMERRIGDPVARGVGPEKRNDPEKAVRREDPVL